MTMTVDSTVLGAGWQVTMPPQVHDAKDQKEALAESTMDEKKEAGSYVNEQPLIVDQQQIADRLDKARLLGEDDKLLLAANLLKGIDSSLLRPIHHDILREAALFKSLLHDNTTSLDQNNTNDGGWIKQGQHTGRHNFDIYYKLNDKSNQLSCRLETIAHSDLLVPILSVLNESELYAAWLPNYNVPRLKVVRSEKLRQSGRVSQVVNVETEVPWPLATRQVILKAVACDNIDGYQEIEENGGDGNECLGKEGGRIIIRLQSLDCNDNGVENLNIQPAKKGVVRMNVRGGFTIEKCSSDHPLAKCSRQYESTSKAKLESSSSSDEDLVLVNFSFCVDPQLAVMPQSFINFFLRTAIGQMWNMFLNVAEEVKEGKRPEHSEAIEKKREILYDWVEERTRVMLGQVPLPST
ncbi:hypothetical protein ACHAXR_013553 [Thalassiosira sp. AJA248-18]